jgi:hypothetical protein
MTEPYFLDRCFEDTPLWRAPQWCNRVEQAMSDLRDVIPNGWTREA